MKRSKFSETQVALIWRRAKEGATIGGVCRKAGISEADLAEITRSISKWQSSQC